MKGYTQIASLLEKGIAGFLLLFGATMLMLMAGLVFVLLSQVGVLVKLSAAVALIFDSAGSLESIFILLLKLIDLALIAVLITIIALSSYQSFVDDIDHLDNMDTEASRGIQKLGMMRPQQLKGKLISTVVGLSSIALLGTRVLDRRDLQEWTWDAEFSVRDWNYGWNPCAVFSDQPHHGFHGEGGR